MEQWLQYLSLIALLGAWFVLNRWVLPRLGIPTCMSGACPTEHRKGEANYPEPVDLTHALGGGKQSITTKK